MKDLKWITKKTFDLYQKNVVASAIEYGYNTQLYYPTYQTELVGDYNLKARELYDKGRISQAKYYSLLMDMEINVFKRCMGRNKVILVDADVISHFMATGYIDRLTEILQPHCRDDCRECVQGGQLSSYGAGQEAEGGQVMERCKVCKIAFPYTNENIRREFFRLKKENPMLGDGERACMSMARFGQEVIASSNFRDVAPYCDENGIEYIGTLDVLTIAMNKGIFTSDECKSVHGRKQRRKTKRISS